MVDMRNRGMTFAQFEAASAKLEASFIRMAGNIAKERDKLTVRTAEAIFSKDKKTLDECEVTRLLIAKCQRELAANMAELQERRDEWNAYNRSLS